MKVMEFAIAEKKSGFCIDARNPYIWTDCGSIVVPFDATDDHIELAKQNANIPSNALCVRAELL